MKRLVLVITLAIVISLSNSKVVATTQPDLNAITSIEHSRGFISKLGDIWSGWRGSKVASPISKIFQAGKIHTSFEEGLNYTYRTAELMNTAYRSIPEDILKKTIEIGYKTTDPQGSDAVMFYSQQMINGKLYNVEVLYDSLSNSVWHFVYTTDARGPLSKIVR